MVAGPSRNPAPGHRGCNHGVASINSTPSFRSSAATAPKMVCAFFSLSRSNTLNPRRSGRTSYRFFGAICPTMTHCLMPRRVKALIIFESCPTRTHTISSTNGASAGLVSPVNATATRCRTPAARACRAKHNGNAVSPAMSRVSRWLPRSPRGTVAGFVPQAIFSVLTRPGGGFLFLKPGNRVNGRRLQSPT